MKPRRELVHAEDLERTGHQPVVEGRLFAPHVIIPTRHHPIMPQHHFAGDARVVGFVLIPEPRPPSR